MVAVGFPDAAMSREADLVVVNDSPCLRTAKVLPTVSDTTSWRRFVGTYELHDPLISSRSMPRCSAWGAISPSSWLEPADKHQ